LWNRGAEELIVGDLGRLQSRGLALATAKDFGPDAERINREILTLDPKDVQAMNRLARCLEERGAKGEAIATFEDVLALDPGNQVAVGGLIRLRPKVLAVEPHPRKGRRLVVHGIPAVVLPVQSYYLDEIVRHPDDLTTMNFGWQSKDKKLAKKLVTPERLCNQLGHLPFLFRASQEDDPWADKTPGRATHAALAGLIVHGDSPHYLNLKRFLSNTKVERLIPGMKRRDELGQREIGSFYVVAGVVQLPDPIPYPDLNLRSQNRPLDPKMNRGYAIVDLPVALKDWHDRAISKWNSLSTAAGLQAISGANGVIAYWVIGRAASVT
jgi:hypothetical protein